MSIIIKNSLKSNTSILVDHNKYTSLYKLHKGDSIIDKNGYKHKIDKIIHKGKKETYKLYHSQWRQPTKVSYDQHYDTGYNMSLLDSPRISYIKGFIISFILGSGIYIDNKLTVTVNNKSNFIKKINNYFSEIYGINNIMIYENNDKIIYTFNLCINSPDMISVNNESQKGIADGLLASNLYSQEHVNTWLKNQDYSDLSDNLDDLYDIELNGGNSFIGNNIVFFT